VLTRLLKKARRPRADVVDAVMDYVPGAVALGYVDNDFSELPPPSPDFAEHIGTLLDAVSLISGWSEQEKPTRPESAPRLSGRSARRPDSLREARKDCTRR
jgi:hypothetical protein